MTNSELIQKYNIPGPRYTSYPTPPFWKNDPLEIDLWKESIKKNLDHFQTKNISLYIHLPFCESLCTFCGCHKRITKNHAVEQPYIDALIKEWKLYKELLGCDVVIQSLHLGGGTPTFFNPKELIRLLQSIFTCFQLNPQKHEMGFEAHPNNTSEEHLKALFDFGFRRVSFGIQDYSPLVQKTINRIQSFEQVQKVHSKAREIGYTSISHDLVYGLPKQTLSDIKETIEQTLNLLPDRISLYGYAHVPWIKGNGQRGYEENDIPKDAEKRALYEMAKIMLLDAGYIEIGMDHFALPTDELAKSLKREDLHRNFMGYTTKENKLMIGIGMSAISDSWFGFAQNEKNLEDYLEKINQNQLPIFRGHELSELDLEIRSHILNLMCHFKTQIKAPSLTHGLFDAIKTRLEPMVEDGLVKISETQVCITEKGRPFVRNCCMAFDQDINQHRIEKPLFSNTI